MAQAQTTCTVCQSSDARIFVRLPQVPIHCNLLWSTREGALGAPRGDMELAFCPACGHVFNAAFDPVLMEYTQAYENSLHFSPRFQAYAEALADRLISSYDLRHKDVIDIGCGKGDFLAMLCERGDNRGYGFDPSYVPENMDASRAARMTIVQDFYSPRYASTKAELISCRHVLEHIRYPREFLASVREAVGSRTGTIVFFEVPNVLYTLKDLGIWDLIYEHCSYFSPPSLKTAFVMSSFAVKGLQDLYEGQFLGIDSVAAATPDALSGSRFPDEVKAIGGFVSAFQSNYDAKVAHWKKRFAELASRNARIAIWGGGSKGVTFLNTLRPGDVVKAMVDINPRKQGMFVAGTGQPVVGPEALREIRPDLVVVMNPVYKEEIRSQLAALGLSPALELA